MRCVALLRGVNVGGRVVKMAEVKSCFEEAGFKAVVTILQSGNVLFTASGATARLKPRIEAALTDRFAYPARVLVYPLDELAAMVAQSPFGDAGPGAHQYMVFHDPSIGAELKRLGVGLDTTIERVAPGAGCVYWTVPKGRSLDSDFAKQLTRRALAEHLTVRNVNTVKKIVAKG
jgi:uncharacterized protein (DUF1697 family)